MSRNLFPTNKQPIVDGVISQDPYWILVTFPYEFVDTMDRAKFDSGDESGFRIVSSDDARPHASDVRQPILFDAEVKSWVVQDAKSSHLHGFSAEMYNGDNSLAMMAWVNPGDWCMFWAFNNRSDYIDTRNRLIAKHNCFVWSDRGNQSKDKPIVAGPEVTAFDGGLKFIGRVSSLVHRESRRPTGQFDVGYTLQATAFSELDMTIYYNDLIAFKYNDAYKFYPDFGVTLHQLLNDEPGHNRGYINTNTFVTAVVKVSLGVGPGRISKDKGDTKLNIGPYNLASSPNVQFEVPNTVASILGFGNKKIFYSDLLTQYVGVQSYLGGQTPTVNKAGQNPYRTVIPDIASASADGSIQYMRVPLRDYFPPDALKLKDVSIWNFVEGYTNRPLNELYTALRPHPSDGRLLPSLVLRRVPYSTDEYALTASNGVFLEGTAFSSLPRWDIPPEMVYESTIGRTDALRFNYVHLTPATFPSKSATEKEREAYVLAPPVVDEVSIKRYGLRMLNTRVAGFADVNFETKSDTSSARYTSFMADIMMDAHLKLSGQLTTCGIQECIQPGDNVFFNGVLFHAESISHQGGISATGSKNFTTSISMSHGIPLRLTGKQQGRLFQISTKKKDIASNQQKFLDSIDESVPTLAAVQQLIKEENEFKSDFHPKSDIIYKERNDRTDLTDVGLTGSRTGMETE